MKGAFGMELPAEEQVKSAKRRAAWAIVVAVIACVVLGGVLLSQRAERTPEPGRQSEIAEPDDNDEVTVYVTRTGTKYHRGSCRYVSRSKIPMKLSKAKARYHPCRVCKPPE